MRLLLVPFSSMEGLIARQENCQFRERIEFQPPDVNSSPTCSTAERNQGPTPRGVGSQGRIQRGGRALGVRPFPKNVFATQLPHQLPMAKGPAEKAEMQKRSKSTAIKIQLGSFSVPVRFDSPPSPCFARTES